MQMAQLINLDTESLGIINPIRTNVEDSFVYNQLENIDRMSSGESVRGVIKEQEKYEPYGPMPSDSEEDYIKNNPLSLFDQMYEQKNENSSKNSVALFSQIAGGNRSNKSSEDKNSSQGKQECYENYGKISQMPNNSGINSYKITVDDYLQKEPEIVCSSSDGKVIRKCPQETKNIPKNYGRAIISFILMNKSLVRNLMKKGQKYEEKELVSYLRKKKKTIRSILSLREIWLEETKNSREIRILSLLYLRKYSLAHIFNSKIKNFSINIKYRRKIIEAVKKPSEFCSLKEF